MVYWETSISNSHHFEWEYLNEEFANVIKIDKKILLQCIYFDWKSFGWASKQLKQNEDFLTDAIYINFKCTEYLTDIKYKDIIVKCRRQLDHWTEQVCEDEQTYQYASERIKTNRIIARIAIKKDPNLLKYAPEIVCNDNYLFNNIMADKSGPGGSSLQYAGELIRKDKPIVLKAIISNKIYYPCAMQWADKTLQYDREFAESVIKHDYRCFKWLDISLRTSQLVIQTLHHVKRTILPHNWPEYRRHSFDSDCSFFELLQFSSQNRIDILLKIVKCWPLEYFSIPMEFRTNESIIHYAFRHKNMFEEIKTRMPDLLQNESFVHTCITKMRRYKYSCRSILEELPEKFKKNHEIIKADVEKGGLGLFYAHESLKNDKKFVEELVEINSEQLQWASSSIKSDPELILKTMKKSLDIINYASDTLKNNLKFCALVGCYYLEQNIENSWEWVPTQVYKYHIDEIIEKSVEMYNYRAINKTLGIFTMDEELNDVPEDKCAICLDFLDDHLGKIQCEHMFHIHCLVSLVQHNNLICPLCREPITYIKRLKTPKNIIKDVVNRLISTISADNDIEEKISDLMTINSDNESCEEYSDEDSDFMEDY